jgi:hypothetical protein
MQRITRIVRSLWAVPALLALAAALLFTLPVLAQSAGLLLGRGTIASGSGSLGDPANGYTLAGTVGQPAAQAGITSGSYTLHSGLWEPQQTADVEDIVPLTEVAISGPDTATIGTSISFTVTGLPADATLPMTCTWVASGKDPITRTLTSLTDSIAYDWTIPGTKTITVTTLDAGGTPVTATHTLIVQQATTEHDIYLPHVTR